jgi:hypothetical protein
VAKRKMSYHCPRREFNSGRPARSLVTVLTELSRLLALNIDKGKGKVVPVLITEHRAMKACWGVEVWLHSFFDLGTRWR